MSLNNTCHDQNKPEIINKAILSFKWSALAQILPRLVTPITTLILAALLVPEDFGIVAASALIISLAQIMVGMGFGATVIQRKTMVEETASISFWMSLVLAVLLFGLLFIFSPSLALFYKMPPLTSVLRVTGLSLIISAFTTIPMALLQRNLEFKKIFFISAIPQIINAFVSVLFAFLTFGYWALIIGNITSLVCSAVLTWKFCRWRPKIIWRTDIANSIFVFSIWIFFANIQTWLFLSGDNALAGYFFGPKGLGQYSVGFNIATLLGSMIISPISAIAYPTFCKLKNNYEIGKEFIKIQSMAASILFPLCFTLSAVALPLVYLLYGDKWPELGRTIHILAILPGTASIFSLNADAFRAAGKPSVWTHISSIGLLFLLPTLYFSGSFGLLSFTLSRALGSIIIPILCILASKNLLSISVKEQIKGLKIPMLGSIVILIFLNTIIPLFSPYQGFSGWIKISLFSIIGFTLYLIILRIFDKQLFQSLFGLFFLAFFPNSNIIKKIFINPSINKDGVL